MYFLASTMEKQRALGRYAVSVSRIPYVDALSAICWDWCRSVYTHRPGYSAASIRCVRVRYDDGDMVHKAPSTMVKKVSLELQFGSACALHRRVGLKPGLGEVYVYILVIPYA